MYILKISSINQDESPKRIPDPSYLMVLTFIESIHLSRQSDFYDSYYFWNTFWTAMKQHFFSVI